MPEFLRDDLDWLDGPMQCSDCGGLMDEVDPEFVRRQDPAYFRAFIELAPSRTPTVAVKAFSCDCGNLGLRASGSVA